MGDDVLHPPPLHVGDPGVERPVPRHHRNPITLGGNDLAVDRRVDPAGDGPSPSNRFPSQWRNPATARTVSDDPPGPATWQPDLLRLAPTHQVYLDTATYGLPPTATFDALVEAAAGWWSGTMAYEEAWEPAGEACRGWWRQ